MSHNKAIASGKEYRKPYTKAKAVDKSCRNHGDCPYCYHERTYKFRQQLTDTKLKEEEYYYATNQIHETDKGSN